MVVCGRWILIFGLSELNISWYLFVIYNLEKKHVVWSQSADRNSIFLQPRKNFLDGTLSIAKKISDDTENKNLISVLGGGDTISAINKSDKKLNFTHLSTAGGAFLEYIEGKDLPGLSVLK